MAKAYLSNGNERMTAILKVVGIYLITLILLIILFRTCQTVKEEVPIVQVEEIEKLRSDNKKLQELIVYLDTLAFLNNQLIEIEGVILEFGIDDKITEVGTKKIEKSTLEGSIKKFFEKLDNVETSEEINDTKAKSKEIYTFILGARDKISIQRSKIIEQSSLSKEEKANLLEQLNSTCQEDIKRLNQKIEDLNRELQKSENQISDQNNIATGQSQELENSNISIENVKKDLEDLHNYLLPITSRGGPQRKMKNSELNVVYQNVKSALDKLDR